MIAIDAARLSRRLSELARFGALPGGGVTRHCWGVAYEDARRWLIGEMKAAGLTTWVDGAGNVFGATGVDRVSKERPIVLTGSHIDTVPEGGTLDGALGVMAGLECLHAIVETKTATKRPLAVAAWSDEEGRYGSLFGSRAFCGKLEGVKIDDMAAVDGEKLVDVMRRAGFDPARVPEAKAPAGSVAAYVELHIEQGPRLEETGIDIGVVQAIVGVRRSRLIFHGQADHAGTTPMERRRDAFLGAADYALKAREHVVTRGSAVSVTNIGVVYVHPGATNIVPGRTELMHEMRDPDVTVLERLATECRDIAERVAAQRQLRLEIRPLSATVPAICSQDVQSGIEAVCAKLGFTTQRMYSAAGHDAQNLASFTESGMIFIPSTGGKSHRIDETSDPRAIERGANVLLHTLVDLANR
jgi:beta-ureidopropionase / N-carbamoyl-L-amino-acid hydrolase